MSKVGRTFYTSAKSAPRVLIGVVFSTLTESESDQANGTYLKYEGVCADAV
jgi:hypothetical protein